MRYELALATFHSSMWLMPILLSAKNSCLLDICEGIGTHLLCSPVAFAFNSRVAVLSRGFHRMFTVSLALWLAPAARVANTCPCG
jgi:hypothetical protein